jgi:hypothetical protein
MQSRPEKLTITLTAAFTYFLTILLTKIGLVIFSAAYFNVHITFAQLFLSHALFADIIFVILAYVMFCGHNWARYAFAILLPLGFIIYLVRDLHYYVTNWQAHPHIHGHLTNNVYWLVIDLIAICIFVAPLFTEQASAFFNKQSSN